MPERELLTTGETADWLAVRPQTLAKWRCTAEVEIPFVRIGRTIRYRKEDLMRFLATNTVAARTTPQ